MATVISTIVFVTSVNAATAIRYVPGGYSTIQAAINDASAGDTIDIAFGTYTENLVVDKQLIIQGAGSGNNPSVDTIINASGGTPGILLEAGGISAATADRLTIKNLRIINSTLDGIRAYNSAGLNLHHVTLENLVITNNGGKGIELHNGTNVSDMKITNCELINNTAQGLRASSGTPVDGLLITDSCFNGNSYGIYHATTVSNLTILRSTFNNNSNYGAYMSEYGLMENIVFEGCQFNDNNTWGFVLWSGHAAGIDGFSITGCSVDNNGLGAWIGADVISNFLIECSSVANNTYGRPDYYEGIEFNYGTLTNVAIHNTNIEGNLDEGVANYGTGIVDATGNWWGDASGPSGEGPGTGDRVTENVDFNPWSTSPHSFEYDCSGFYAPMDKGPVKVRKNKVLPLKCQLLDTNGFPVTDADISSPPIIQVTFEPSGGGDVIDVTDDALSAGKGTEGNQCYFDSAGSNWAYNLMTKNYTCAGTYTITVISGSPCYSIANACTASFVIED